MGYEILGFLDKDPKKLGKKYLGITVIGSIADLENITKTYKSKDIMVATPHMPRTELKELLSKCESISESMWLIPRSGDFITEGVDIEVIGDVLTLSIKKNLAKPWNIFIKNLFDRIFSLILIILFLPIFILISIAIKLDSKGPAMFKQKRLGQGKEMFSLYKFRSMSLNNESKLRDYLSQNENARKEWEEYKKLKGYDPRLTKIGRLLRKFSLDELPQLLNVLQGKMSFVGPRPYIYEEIEDSHSFINTIIKVKPGITGLWQISGRSELPFKQRLALDEYYIRNWSLWLDIVILLKSIKVLFSSKGAY
jgi:undecaprenyl-phosphate galactose phosphotransferase